MPNMVLNSSFEKFSSPLLSGGAVNLPDSWLRINSGVNVTPEFDYGPDRALHGSVAVNMVRNIGGTVGQEFGIYQESCSPPAAVGASVVFSVWMFPPYTPRDSMKLVMEFHNAAHAVVGTASATFASGAFTYNQVLQQQFVTAVIPAGTHHISVSIRFVITTDDTVGTTYAYCWFDKAQLEAGTVPTGYKPSYKDALDIYDNGQYLFKNLVMNAHSPVYVSSNLSPITETYTEFGNGGQITVTKADGMYDLPEIKSSGDFESDFSHGGALGSPDFLSMRRVTIDLSLIATDERTLHGMMSSIRTTLMEAINDPNYSKFYWKRNHATLAFSSLYGVSKKWSYARIRRYSGFTSTYEMAAGHQTSGSIEFVFPDPAWYDFYDTYYDFAVPAGNLSYTAADGEGNFGRGTFRSFPRIRINGPVTNPAVFAKPEGVTSEPYFSRGIRLAVAIPGGQYVDIDTRNRTVVHSSGADWKQYLSPSNQWHYLASVWLPASAYQQKFIRWVFQSTVNGTGYTVRVTDTKAWI